MTVPEDVSKRSFACAWRWCLFGYLVLLMCPIRFWPINGDSGWHMGVCHQLRRRTWPCIWMEHRVPRGPHSKFFGLLLAIPVLVIPVLVSAKHGFVRQDFHVVNFFGFLPLTMGLILLVVSYRGVRANYASALLFVG